MDFLLENPEVKAEAQRLLSKFDEQIEKLRKADVLTFRRKIDEASDIEAKSKIVRHLLETNVPACVDLLDRLLEKHKNDKFLYLEWMFHRVQVAMSLESFKSARDLAEKAHATAKDLHQSLKHSEDDKSGKPAYKAYIKSCINLLLVCRFQGKVADTQVYLEEAQSVTAAENDRDDRHYIRILHGDLLLARGLLNNAIDTVFLPLLLRERNVSPVNRGLLLQKLGNACRSAAQWGLAKDYLRQSIKIAQDLGDLISEFDRVTDLGNVYRSEGRIADALKQQVAHMAFAFKRGDLWGLTISCFNMGFAYYSITPKPDLWRSLKLLTLKHDLAVRTDNEPLRGMALNNLGKVFCALSQYEMALKVMSQSLLVAQETLNKAGEGMAYGNIGTAYRSLGQYDQAIENHNKYLVNASGRGDDGGAAIMQRELSIDYLCKGDLENAEKQVRNAISTLETIRSKLGSEDTSKIANFDKNQAETYSLLQVILARQGKHVEALALSELARSRALTDLIRDRLIKTTRNQTESWIYSSNFESRWQEIAEDIISDYTTVADELNTNFLVYSVIKDYSADGSIEQWLYIWVVLNEISCKGQDRFHFKRVILNEKIQRELHSDTGFFASLTRSFRMLNSKETIVQLEMKEVDKVSLKEEEVLVNIPESPDVQEFLSLLESLSLTSTLTTEKESAESEVTRYLPKDSRDLKNDAEEESQEDRADIELERLLELGSWTNEGLKQLVQLYEVCIAPVEDCLPDSDEVNVPNVTIIPHEFLFSVPFCCLHDESKKYFIERYVLNYAPSLRALLLLNQRLRYLKNKQGSRKVKMLAMGDPVMVLPGIRNLPCSGEEAKNVQAVFGAEVCQLALRFDATKRRLLNELQNIDILHLATHACPEDAEVRFFGLRKENHGIIKDLVGNENSQGDYSMRGCLLLASSDDECEGVVEASEISSLHCSCQLVMLSCCETGLGKLTGDGVVGLYRAFFAAGAASVIVTLWKISDVITPIFMEHFYIAFKATGNVASSVRSAMMYCIREKKLPPQQWAAFSMIGAFSPHNNIVTI